MEKVLTWVHFRRSVDATPAVPVGSRYWSYSKGNLFFFFFNPLRFRRWFVPFFWSSSEAYILKARVLVVQTPQTICNFPQKDCLRTRKLSVDCPWKLTILQYVTNKGQAVLKSLAKKQNLWLTCSRFQIFWHFALKWCILRLFNYLRTFVAKF